MSGPAAAPVAEPDSPVQRQATALLDRLKPFGEPGGNAPAGRFEETALLRFALESMPVGFSLFDPDDRLLLWNERFFQIWPVPTPWRCRGVDFTSLTATLDYREIEHPDCPLQPVGTPGQRRREFLLGDGRRVEVHVDLLQDGSAVAIHEDVTQKRASEARVRFLAGHDCLTGLPNRSALYSALERDLRGRAATRTAVLYIDLDQFKPINDTLGHAAGDQLLIEAADRLKRCAPFGDLAARIGGDEFVIVQRGLVRSSDATRLGERIVEALSRPYELDGRTAVIGASIGIALADTDHTDSADALLERADQALYRAKASGRGTVVTCDPATARTGR